MPTALHRMVLIAIALLTLTTSRFAFAQELTRGEDWIETPAIGDGLCASNVFQSNMVLQRDKPIAVWGWASPGETVTVSFGGKEQSAAAGDDRSWKVTLDALPASAEPRAMTIKGKDATLTFENVLVGDVWVLGGQSNMEFPLDRVENGALEVVSAHFPSIRIMTVPQITGPVPNQSFPRIYQWSDWSKRHFRQGYWDACTPETARELSAIGYVFARRLHMASQVPIGVIDTSIGGTMVRAWTPLEAMEQIDAEPVKQMLAEHKAQVAAFDPEADLKQRVEQYEARLKKLTEEGKDVSGLQKPVDLRPGPIADRNAPGNCYAGLIAPLTGLSVRGAIFHQGYNDCFNGTQGAVLYRLIFPEMIKGWRQAFNDPAMPFGILSLCTEGQTQTREHFTEMMCNPGPYIREAQYQTFLQFFQAGDKNIGYVSTYDLRRRWYHPQLKVPAGERIARWALATQYGMDKQLQWRPAMLTEMKVEDGRIVLKMDERVGAVDQGLPMEGFAIAGEDRKFHPADATARVTGKDERGRPQYDATTIVLSSPMVPKPVHFRYAWARSPMGNVQLAGNSDVPLATQRSDDWPLEQTPLIDFGGEQPASLERAQRAKLIETLRQIDLDRRLAEANALIEKHKADPKPTGAENDE